MVTGSLRLFPDGSHGTLKGVQASAHAATSVYSWISSPSRSRRSIFCPRTRPGSSSPPETDQNSVDHEFQEAAGGDLAAWL